MVWREETDFEDEHGAVWIRTPRVALTRDTAAARRLFEVVEGNLHNPVREQLWGSSGNVLAAIAMAEHTDEARWAALVQRAVQALWDEMEPIDAAGDTWGWVQNLYGRIETLIGAGQRTNRRSFRTATEPRASSAAWRGCRAACPTPRSGTCCCCRPAN